MLGGALAPASAAIGCIGGNNAGWAIGGATAAAGVLATHPMHTWLAALVPSPSGLWCGVSTGAAP